MPCLYLNIKPQELCDFSISALLPVPLTAAVLLFIDWQNISVVPSIGQHYNLPSFDRDRFVLKYISNGELAKSPLAISWQTKIFLLECGSTVLCFILSRIFPLWVYNCNYCISRISVLCIEVSSVGNKLLMKAPNFCFDRLHENGVPVPLNP